MANSKDPNADHARAATRIQPDVGVEHIADIYAIALLGAAEDAGRTRQALDEFDVLVADVLPRHPKFDAILASNLVSPEEKTGIIDRVLGGVASPLFVNFLKVVARHGRLDCLRAIRRRTGELYDRQRGRIRVQLTTAAPLSSDQAGRVAANLRDALGGEPVVEQIADPELIGGAVLRIGDTVYDGSIANQLKVVRQQMIDRSVHEIQSRRNRFRDPAGD